MADAGRRQAIKYDGTRLRQITTRQTYDFNSSLITYLRTRDYQHDYRDLPYLQPSLDSFKDIVPLYATKHNPATAFCTKYVQTIKNKKPTVINCVRWNPDGRRLLACCHSGEFAFWNGFTFNFETITQCHDCPVRGLEWTHSGTWLVSGDDSGYVKYWEPSLNNLWGWEVHKESKIWDISFAPTDLKFVVASEDNLSVVDFERRQEETAFANPGWGIQTAAWHPEQSLVVSAGKDKSLRFWDPRDPNMVATVAGHGHTISKVKWNNNGLWFATGSRDTTAKVWDLRTLTSFRHYRSHRSDITTISWHPTHEQQLTTASSDGIVLHWNTMLDAPQAEICAHDKAAIWDLAWHPLGHILVTASNDQSARFWAQNLPGDEMRDEYNRNQLPDATRVAAIRDLIKVREQNEKMFGQTLREDDDGQEEETALVEGFIPGLGGASTAKPIVPIVASTSITLDTSKSATTTPSPPASIATLTPTPTAEFTRSQEPTAAALRNEQQQQERLQMLAAREQQSKRRGVDDRDRKPKFEHHNNGRNGNDPEFDRDREYHNREPRFVHDQQPPPQFNRPPYDPQPPPSMSMGFSHDNRGPPHAGFQPGPGGFDQHRPPPGNQGFQGPNSNGPSQNQGFQGPPPGRPMQPGFGQQPPPRGFSHSAPAPVQGFGGPSPMQRPPTQPGGFNQSGPPPQGFGGPQQMPRPAPAQPGGFATGPQGFAGGPHQMQRPVAAQPGGFAAGPQGFAQQMQRPAAAQPGGFAAGPQGFAQQMQRPAAAQQPRPVEPPGTRMSRPPQANQPR